MTVDCQEAMVEAQASERIVAPAGGASTATIESLRARLLSERATSKEARQQAHKIAQKVSELQSRLDAEIEYRKKAEAAMKEVLEVLKAKGLAKEQVTATTTLQSDSSESEEVAPMSSSKDGESQHSSSEEASHAHISNPQGSGEDLESEHEEGCISEDNCSERTQITVEETSRSDSTEAEKEGVNKNEDGSTHEQTMFTDPSESVSPMSGQVGEENGFEQSSEIPRGQVKADSNGGTGLPFANDLLCLPMANQVIYHQETGADFAPNVCLSDGHQVCAHVNKASHPGDVENSMWPQQNDMPMPVTENVSGLRPKDVHPGFFPKNGYTYNMPNMYGDPLQQVHNVSSAEVPFLRRPAFQNREHLRSEVAGFGRYPQVPINDAILSLVDEKKGKLGNILVALQLAKQQLKDEELVCFHMEEKFETSSPTPFSATPTGFYEDVPHQPPYQPWRPEALNPAPIIHFPVSPTSDHEVSAFERHDGQRRSISTSAYYMPSVYDAYLQPKGELHLGNGITLYTD